MASNQQKEYEQERYNETLEEQESENALYKFMQRKFWQQVADKLEKHIAETSPGL